MNIRQSVCRSLLGATMGLAVFGGQAVADEADDIIVTGTRVTGLRAVDSPAPIQVLGVETLERTGQPDLIQALAQNLPSFTAQAFGGDTASLTLSAKLRGVSPNHALVLLNGKRVHGTSNLAVLGGAFQGAAGADLNFLPVSSVERIEVLLDGAAAQYGSDAIAGVINIIQKKDSSGGKIVGSAGQYFDGGGNTKSASINLGFEPIKNSYLNLTYDTKKHDYSFRGDFDPRVVDGPWNVGATNSPARSYPQVSTAEDWPYVNRIAGDPQYEQTVGMFNAGYIVSDAIELYSFGSYGYKEASAYQNYRLPNVVTGKAQAADGTRIDVPFPLGFKPKQSSVETDYSFAVGAKGVIGNFTWDVATIVGGNKNKITVLDTANADYYRDTSVLATATAPYKPGFTPRSILAGTFESSQITTTADFTYALDAGLSKPITIASGVEFRTDGYKLKSGNPISYYKGGSQSYYGFSPTDASDNERDSYAVYLDVAANPIEQLTVDAAVRYGHFSDFGDTTVGKLTARYDFSDALAVRGTASTGFRAPTLAEGFYSGINVGPSSISGQLAPNSAGAKLIGVSGLQPEESKNYSLGLVAKPVGGLTMTLDTYQIEITDRIVGSGTLIGNSSVAADLKSPSVLSALTANGVVIDSSIFSNTTWSITANIFVNGLDTETKGTDFVLTYASDFGDLGRVNWSVSANRTETKVTRIAPSPSQLTGGVVLFNREAVSLLEDTSPEYRIVGGAAWSKGPLKVNVKGTYYGESSALTLASGTYYKTTLEPQLIADLEVGYDINDSWKVTAGANNLFNQYPDEVNSALRALRLSQNSNAYVTKYATFSPYGINGGYYYGKLSYAF